MTPLVVARLRNQGVIAPRFDTPAAVVRALGAVQAQDHAGSLWGIALRTKGATVADVEAAIASRTIVRTWPMRGTLHFVHAHDLRWMTGLLAPRVMSRAAGRYRDLGLDAKAFAKGGIDPGGQRGIHILSMLSMQRVICFGPHHGKQPSFALVDEWIPKSGELDRDAALGELATRYFTSHGPATLADFAWWSGLPQGEASRGIAAAPTIDGKDGMWFAETSPPKLSGTHAELLPPFDELVVAYKDRSAVLDSSLVEATRGGIFSPAVFVDGKIIGTWRRETKRDRAIASPTNVGRAALPEGVRRTIASPTNVGRAALPEGVRRTIASPTNVGRAALPEGVRRTIVHADLRLEPRSKRALDAAVARYGEFLGTRVELVVTGP